MSQPIRVAVTGAAGHIGYALLFRIASGAMFGPQQKVILQLIELPGALPQLEGVKMELQDCAFPLLHDVICTADLALGMRDADWALLVGAVPRKQGMERSDLLSINAKVFAEQGQAIEQYASRKIKVLVVGNPCNTNALITMHHAPSVPRANFYAMTMLDESRARAQLALKAGVPVAEISNMNIWGNHSATQYPDIYQARIAGQPVTAVISDQQWLQSDFIQTVQQRGAAIIKARGASSAASAANAVVDTVYRLTHDTAEGETFSVALCSTGEYGVDEGLIYSYPCRVESGILRVVTDITHNGFAQNLLDKTLAELRNEREAVKVLL